MGQTNGGRRLIDVLTAGAGRPEHVFPDVFFFDVDFNGIGNVRHNVYGREAGLPFSFSVVRTDSNQPVRSGFSLEVSEGERTANDNRRAVDARLLVVLPVDDFDLVGVHFRPVDVHSQEHFRPVVGVGAAVARLNGHDSRIVVDRTGQERFHAQLFERLFHLVDFCDGFVETGLVLFGDFHNGVHVVTGGKRLVKRLDNAFCRLEFVHKRLRLVLIVPESGLPHEVFDFPGARGSAVAVQRRAQFHQLGSSLLGAIVKFLFHIILVKNQTR